VTLSQISRPATSTSSPFLFVLARSISRALTPLLRSRSAHSLALALLRPPSPFPSASRSGHLPHPPLHLAPATAARLEICISLRPPPPASICIDHHRRIPAVKVSPHPPLPSALPLSHLPLPSPFPIPPLTMTLLTSRRSQAHADHL
jgi:hypothetical protein